MGCASKLIGTADEARSFQFGSGQRTWLAERSLLPPWTGHWQRFPIFPVKKEIHHQEIHHPCTGVTHLRVLSLPGPPAGAQSGGGISHSLRTYCHRGTYQSPLSVWSQSSHLETPAYCSGKSLHSNCSASDSMWRLLFGRGATGKMGQDSSDLGSRDLEG